ncbi:OpgC domain-containing protein [Roseomonas sp. SSH11]|uniref:OpgC domain-containing protein n=1 Tax=Pararoseomonas baculiformis TaxID=2820812 RepID=A0ABS4AER6_9PROT|nr:OpgC domain-containing protein [Pararoseomonas baculiformis]MBP0445488.1 OpgC domain-containing protein [Pararoseomonas baculiformis]
MGGLIRQGRDLRVDFARGIALWFIFVDHVPGNVLGRLTIRNLLLCDATEIFVLLAGYAAGIAYGRQMEREGWLRAGTRVAGRCFTLYVAHIFLFVVFTAQVGYSAATLDTSAYLDEMHLDPFRDEPYLALLQALFLAYQPAFLNILPLYIVVLGLFALSLPLLRRPAWLLGASLLLYAVARLLPMNLPSWTGGGWFFNPFAWQLLFAIGAVLGHGSAGKGPAGLPWRRPLGVAAALVLVLSFAITLVIYLRRDLITLLPLPVASVVDAVDKTALHPFRLLSILALAYLVAHAVPRGAGWLRGVLAQSFVLIGQQGLPVFCAGIFLSFLGRLAVEWSEGWAMQLAVNAVGLGAMVAIAAAVAWASLKPARSALPVHPAADTA